MAVLPLLPFSSVPPHSTPWSCPSLLPRRPPPPRPPSHSPPSFLSHHFTHSLLLAPLVLAAPATTAAAAPKAADAVGSLASLKTAQIIPDVVSDFVPTAMLTVDYGKQTPVKMGEELLPSEAAIAPVVTFTGTDPKKVRKDEGGREGGWVRGTRGGRVCGCATVIRSLIDW